MRLIMEKLYNNKNNSYIEFENINYKTSNLTNGWFQGYKVRLYKQNKESLKPLTSVLDIMSNHYYKVSSKKSRS